MAKGRKTGGRQKGTPNRATAGVKELLSEILPDEESKRRWLKWLNHKDDRIGFEAFKLALSYQFGKPGQSAAGEEGSTQVLVDFSTLPRRGASAEEVAAYKRLHADEAT